MSRIMTESIDEYDGGKVIHVELDIPSQIPFKVVACPSLKRVFYHIVSNAVKFCAEDGIVKVAIESSPIVLSRPVTPSSVNSPNESRSCFKFTVTNPTSRPIDAGYIRQYFNKKFYYDYPEDSGDDLSAGKGPGLGLYVAYNLCKLMGGSLECAADKFAVALTCTMNLNLLDAKSDTNLRESIIAQMENRSSIAEFSLSSSNGGSGDFSSHEQRMIKSLAAEVALFKEQHLNSEEKNKSTTILATAIQQSLKEDLNDGKRSRSMAKKSFISAQKSKVLIVDDSTICQKMLSKILDANGYDYDIAGNGKVAVKKLEMSPTSYSAIFMDLCMPIMDGITATKIIRTEMKIDIPVVILSAEIGSHIREEAEKVGMTGFVSKPARAQDIIRELNRFCIRSNLHPSADVSVQVVENKEKHESVVTVAPSQQALINIMSES